MSDRIGAHPMPEVIDRFGRRWRLRFEELCSVCGQPDNCDDCSHHPLSSREAVQLGALNTQHDWFEERLRMISHAG